MVHVLTQSQTKKIKKLEKKSKNIDYGIRCANKNLLPSSTTNQEQNRFVVTCACPFVSLARQKHTGTNSQTPATHKKKQKQRI